ncbi:hypothetical protein [Gordonia hydrophobica]|uniref:Mce-associated membrane protein n=1 Tax=Gordonia hydrophobica TaxID=40516 RepID=A0ABZ2TWG0_9ACTN|nr:hypothetical protein [Gordonia hydrophobica]MBM7365777.1 Mce-associated membrane protein [Gordonia hydrophobica]
MTDEQTDAGPAPDPQASRDRQSANLRLQQAQQRYDAAVEAEAQAREAAAPARLRRSHRRAAAIRLTVVVAVLAALVLGAIGWWAHSSAASISGDLDDERTAEKSAEQAIVTMLTADPAHAAEYVKKVVDVTTGDQQVRVRGTSTQLQELVAAQPRPATGQILASGVVGRDRSGITVLVVAQTTTPELVGGDADRNRVGVSVTMKQVDDHWLVARAEAVS